MGQIRTGNVTIDIDHSISYMQALYTPSPKNVFLINVKLWKPVFQNWSVYFPPKIEGALSH